MNFGKEVEMKCQGNARSHWNRNAIMLKEKDERRRVPILECECEKYWS